MTEFTKVHAERLKLLVTRLLSLSPERFDFSYWVGKDWGGKDDLSCGTTCCALGLATTIPEFQDLGLCLVKIGGNPFAQVMLREDRAVVGSSDTFYFTVKAANKIFGLDKREVEYLFTPDDGYYDPDLLPPNATAQEVAERIEAFIYNKGF